MLADMEARLNVIEADQAEVRATQTEVRVDQAKVRTTHAEVRADQVTQAEQIALVQKQSEEDLIFMRDLNAQMEACLSH
jgi:ribosomal protein L22